MMGNVEEIARGLTAADREFVLMIISDDWWRTDENTPRGPVGALITRQMLDFDYVAGWGELHHLYRLTPLGLAVREHLRDLAEVRAPGRVGNV